MHLKSRGIEHFLPCYETLRQWKDRRVKLDRPLFPGYIFIHLPFAQRLKALSVPHVIGLVGPAGSSSVIPEDEIAVIRRATEYRKIEPHPYLKVGQRVLITDGAMAGMQGVLVRMQNGPRVVISLDSIHRAFVVEISGASLAPIECRHVPGSDQPAERMEPATDLNCLSLERDMQTVTTD